MMHIGTINDGHYYGFFSCVEIIFYLACFLIFTCLYFILNWLTQPATFPEIQE